MRIGPFVLLVVLAFPARAAEHWVSADARRGGEGTREAPYTLEEALAQPARVKPGDTVWLKGGVYRGTFTSRLEGTASSPIVVRARPRERVTLDGGDSNGKAILTVGGAYTWFWGFEVTSSDPKRQSSDDGSWPKDIARGEGVQILQSPGSGKGVKLIDLVIHDARQGVSFWAEAEDAEVHGCLIYANGWDGATGRGHGHGIYVQNRTGTKRIENNAIFDQFGGGIQAYGSEKAALDNLEIVGNTIWDSGALSRHGYDRNLLLGGGVRARNARIVANATYYANGPGNNLGYGAGCENTVVEDNLFASGGEGPSLYLVECGDGMKMRGNTFLGPVKGLTPPAGNRVVSKERGAHVIVRKDAYEKGRALVTVFNWEKARAVRVDPGAVLARGDAYELRSVTDVFGPPVLSGTWDGARLVVPMTNLPPVKPVGWTPPPSTAPELGVFVLQALPR
jgi:hypothetical protein